METETTTAATEPEVDEMPESWRRAIRISIVAVVIALLGVGLGGVSVLVQAADVRRESRQTSWDQRTAEHQRCVTAAENRAATIETGRDQFNGQFRQIAGRLDTIDLLEGLIALLPPSDVTTEALTRTQESRERIQMDGIQTAAELAAFDAKRPPLDPAACPPPPDGPRP